MTHRKIIRQLSRSIQVKHMSFFEIVVSMISGQRCASPPRFSILHANNTTELVLGATIAIVIQIGIRSRRSIEPS